MNTVGSMEWLPNTLEDAISHIKWLRKELRATRILYLRTSNEAANCPHCAEQLGRFLECIIKKDAEDA